MTQPSTAHYSINDYQTAATYIAQKTAHRPRIALTLGSGLGDLADRIEAADVIPYTDIPGWPQPHSAVEGHKLRLVIGKLEGREILAFQGRQHFYEGYTMQES